MGGVLTREKMGIISAVFSQNEILQQEVYLFDLLDTSNREVMTHLKAICFIRPTQENLFLLADELKKPKYEQYHLCKASFFHAWTRSHPPRG